jgi:hypothetical protein
MGLFVDFNIAKQDAQAEVLDEFDKTLGELKIKNQVLIVI